jgi:hypothetical protein
MPEAPHGFCVGTHAAASAAMRSPSFCRSPRPMNLAPTSRSRRQITLYFSWIPSEKRNTNFGNIESQSIDPHPFVGNV